MFTIMDFDLVNIGLRIARRTQKDITDIEGGNLYKCVDLINRCQFQPWYKVHNTRSIFAP